MMTNIRLWLRQNFDFNQREISGFFILIILMFLFLLLPFIVDLYYPNAVENTAKDKIKLDSLMALIEQKSNKINETKPKYKNKSVKEIKIQSILFDFNPNTETKNGLVKLGIDPYVAARMINYRKYKPFRIKSDILKTYGFDSVLYKKLASYILLPENLANTEVKKPSFQSKTTNYVPKLTKIDINNADSLQFEKIYGIGSKLASRILKYRNKLGGFISMDQLKEVYGLDTTVLAELGKKMYILDNYHPAKIRINFATVDDLKQHPYIGYKFAKTIISYRNTHGGIKSEADLMDIKILSLEEVQKMNPYLEYE